MPVAVQAGDEGFKPAEIAENGQIYNNHWMEWASLDVSTFSSQHSSVVVIMRQKHFCEPGLL